MDKLYDFIKAITGKDPRKQTKSSDSPVDAEVIRNALEATRGLNKQFDEANEIIKDYQYGLQEFNKELKKMLANDEEELKIAKLKLLITQEQLNLEDAKNKAEKLNIENQKTLNEIAEKNKLKPADLKRAMDSYDDQAEAAENSTESLSRNRDMFNKVSDAVGFNANSLLEFTTVAALFSQVFDAAAKQVVRLNSEMITFQRTMSGALNATALGFDIYGNDVTANRSGSIDTVAGTNNLELSELLSTFEAFSDGQVIGLTNDLQKSQDELLKYGVAVARTSKLYGVSQSVITEFSKTMTQSLGVKIEDMTSIIEHGAEVAANAGVNINKFFENMQQIANLTGEIFTKGGAGGIEKTAMVLSKLGLQAYALEEVSNSIKDFGSLVEKQNAAAILGLSNYSAATSRIFAKNQTGDAGGALLLQQTNLAKDIDKIYTNREGSINTQGLTALKQIGLQRDQISSIQGLIKAHRITGASFEDLANETNLTVAQLAQKRQIEQENMTMLEKVGVMWKTIQQTFIDPIASLLGPLLDITLTGLNLAFKTLFFLLKPVIDGFERVGGWLNIIAQKFNYVSNVMTATMDKLGLGSKGGNNLFNAVSWLTTVIIGFKAFAVARWAWERAVQAGRFVSSLIPGGGGNLLRNIGSGLGRAGGSLRGAMGSGVGGNLLKKLGRGLGKGGGGLGAIAGLAGTLIGDDMGGKSGNTVSSVSSSAGIGAMIGSMILPGIGTAIGAALGGVVGLVTSSWDEIDSIWQDGSKNTFEQIWETFTVLGKNAWDAMKDFSTYLNKSWMGWFVNPVGKAVDNLTKSVDESNKLANQDNIQISSMSGGASAFEQLAVMRVNGASSLATAQAQTEAMNKTFTPNKQPTVKVTINQNDLMGGYKVKAQGS